MIKALTVISGLLTLIAIWQLPTNPDVRLWESQQVFLLLVFFACLAMLGFRSRGNVSRAGLLALMGIAIAVVAVASRPTSMNLEEARAFNQQRQEAFALAIETRAEVAAGTQSTAQATEKIRTATPQNLQAEALAAFERKIAGESASEIFAESSIPLRQHRWTCNERGCGFSGMRVYTISNEKMFFTSLIWTMALGLIGLSSLKKSQRPHYGNADQN
jgi:hypothetical protein